jgi:hypothetical protein
VYQRLTVRWAGRLQERSMTLLINDLPCTEGDCWVESA